MTSPNDKDYKGFVILGIDPGFKGGLSFLCPRDMSVKSYPMPILKDKKSGKTSLDTTKIITLIEDFVPSRMAIERNHSRPGQGVSSSITFGYWSGFFEGHSAGYLMPMTLVPPQVWMKDLFQEKRVGNVKMSVAYCQRLWPNNVWVGTPRSKTPHDGMTDSALIALYLWRKIKRDMLSEG